MKEEKLKDQFTSDDKGKIEPVLNEISSWLEHHPNAEAEEYEKKTKELEEVFNPIMTRIYQATGG
jgi:L1 cell adhesion molecule like protein